MIKVSRWLACSWWWSLSRACSAGGWPRTRRPRRCPSRKESRWPGMPEVLPTQDELKAAIPPSLLEMDTKGKTIRIMFQGGGDSAPAVEMKDFIKEKTGLEIEIDVIPPESLHEKQLSTFTAGSSEYDLMELYPTWIGEYAEAGYIDNLDPLYEKYAQRDQRRRLHPGRSGRLRQVPGLLVRHPLRRRRQHLLLSQGPVGGSQEAGSFQGQVRLRPEGPRDLGRGAGHGRVLQPAGQRASTALAPWRCAPGGPSTTGPTCIARCSPTEVTERHGQRQGRDRAATRTPSSRPTTCTWR